MSDEDGVVDGAKGNTVVEDKDGEETGVSGQENVVGDRWFIPLVIKVGSKDPQGSLRGFYFLLLTAIRLRTTGVI